MKQIFQHIRSIKYNTNPLHTTECTHHLFFSMFACKNENSTIFTDFIGNLPVHSLDGHNFLSIFYDLMTNAILVEPMKNAKDEMIVVTFHIFLDSLAWKAFKPTFHVINNVASKMFKEYLNSNNIGLQLVESHNLWLELDATD